MSMSFLSYAIFTYVERDALSVSVWIGRQVEGKGELMFYVYMCLRMLGKEWKV